MTAFPSEIGFEHDGVEHRASIPQALHISPAKALQTAESGLLVELGDAFFHPLRDRKLQADRFPSSCETKPGGPMKNVGS